MPRAARILALVLAGGEGRRLRPLTEDQPKPALPFVDGYRIIDFVLSNLLNSGITSVYVLGQYKPHCLVSHIHSAWRGRFASAGGFVRTVLPQGTPGTAFLGTADAVHRNIDLVREHQPDLVAVFAADHVYRMDVRQMARFHADCDAEVTVAATRVPLALASLFGIVVTDERHRIRAFVEKPEHPKALCDDPGHAFASMGNYLFEPLALLRLLDACIRKGGTDFGHHMMPALPSCARGYAYDFSENRVPGLRPWEVPAYWRDVGTPEALSAARHDADGATPRIDLGNREWPMHKERRRCVRASSEGDDLEPAHARDGAPAAIEVRVPRRTW